MSKFFKVLIIFALVLAAVGYGFWRKNIYSKEELKLEIFGPREAALGQEVEYVVKYKEQRRFSFGKSELGVHGAGFFHQRRQNFYQGSA